MELLVALCLGLGLSASCGFRVFVPLLAMSLAAKAGFVTPSGGFEWLGTWPAVITFGVACLAEVGGYYVPWIDNALDTVATPAAIAARDPHRLATRRRPPAPSIRRRARRGRRNRRHHPDRDRRSTRHDKRHYRRARQRDLRHHRERHRLGAGLPCHRHPGRRGLPAAVRDRPGGLRAAAPSCGPPRRRTRGLIQHPRSPRSPRRPTVRRAAHDARPWCAVRARKLRDATG